MPSNGPSPLAGPGGSPPRDRGRPVAIVVGLLVIVLMVGALATLIARDPAPLPSTSARAVPQTTARATPATTTSRPRATVPPTTARPPTTTAPAVTLPPSTTSDAQKIAFCAAWEQAKRVSTLPAAEYVAVIRTMAANAAPSTRAAWEQAVRHLEAGLAIKGTAVTGDKLWHAAEPFPPETMSIITNDAVARCR